MSYEGVGLSHKMAFEPIMRMALVGSLRAHAGGARLQLGMVSQVVDPPERLRDEAQVLAEKIARNSPAAMRATKRALWGALETGLTDACRAGAQELVGMWGHPDQEEGPLAFAEKRDARWMEMHMERRDVSTYDTLKLERHGPVGLADQQPARAAQRDEQPHARRVRRRVARARRRSRGEGDRAHRRGARLPDRRRREGDRHRRDRASSGTASRSRTGTCTSPPGSRASTSR